MTFASKYADEVSGLALLDASPTSWPATVCSVAAYEGGCAVMHDPTLSPERLDVFRAFEEVATITSLGDLPMTVITAAHRTDPALTQSELARLDAVWAEGVGRWAGLSSSSSVVSVENTGHNIELDQPQVVIQELLDLLVTTAPIINREQADGRCESIGPSALSVSGYPAHKIVPPTRLSNGMSALL